VYKNNNSKSSLKEYEDSSYESVSSRNINNTVQKQGSLVDAKVKKGKMNAETEDPRFKHIKEAQKDASKLFP